MTTTSSKDLRLTGIIEEIYSGDYQLPEFQRDYVWKDSNVKSLFESVLLGHPIGSLLILELNNNTQYVRERKKKENISIKFYYLYVLLLLLLLL